MNYFLHILLPGDGHHDLSCICGQLYIRASLHTFNAQIEQFKLYFEIHLVYYFTEAFVSCCVGISPDLII